MSKFVGIVVGALEIVGGIVAAAFQLYPLAGFLIASGAGMILSGVGTLLAGTSGGAGGTLAQGIAVATRNPIAPWNVIYGRTKIGGTIIYIHEFGDSNKYLDLVMVLACHQCQAVDGLIFDNKRVQIDGNGDSFQPLQQTENIASITRLNNVVTVVLNANIPLLVAGDSIIIQNVTGDRTLNGVYPVDQIVSQTVGTPGAITFRYLNGGTAVTYSNQGQTKTSWPDYGRKIHMEVLLGNHTATFPGMLAGTANDGDLSNLINDGSNPWTSAHKLLGKTAVFLRLHYNDTIFASGLPQIGFLIRGKNDILDPRTSPVSYGYTENSALCIADYLSNTTFGLKAVYGTEIPLAPLIAAANICDEAVPLANGGTEKRYTLNGTFQLTLRRGEVLQNMLTSCGGRISYAGGQFLVQVAAWPGSSATITQTAIFAGSFRWKTTPQIRDLYNGVKGTFVSPSNRWQASDFPPYAQDVRHGYASDANLAADGGDRRWLDIQLPFTISVATAQRLAKIELLRRRQLGTGTFVLNMAGYKLAALDVISVSLAYFGWSSKLLEIQAHRFKQDRQELDGGEVTALGVEIDVQETASTIYDWGGGDELTPQGYQQANLPTQTTDAVPNVWCSAGEWPYPLGANSFSVQQVNVGTSDPIFYFGGKSPVNIPSKATGTPTLGAASAVAGSGNIGTAGYFVAVTALDAAGKETLISGPAPVNVASSGSHIILPVTAADVNTVLFRGYIGLIPTRLLRAAESATSPVTITDYPQNGYGYPDPAFSHYRFQGKRLWSSGAQTIAIVNVVTTIPGGAPGGTACVASFTNTGGQAIVWTTDQWAGRYLSHVGQAKAQAAPIRAETIGIVDALILGNTTDGKLYLAQNIALAHYYPNSTFVGPILGVGDYFTIRHLPTSITSSGFTDATIPVPTSGGFDLTAYIVAGLGAGSVVPLASISAGGVVVIAGAWPYGPPDASSIILIAEKTWSYDSDAQPAVVDGSETAVTYNRPTSPVTPIPFWPIVGGLQVPNAAQAILFRVLTCNVFGTFLDDADVQYRDVYVVAQGTGASVGAAY
jgi:hypothetical protein